MGLPLGVAIAEKLFTRDKVDVLLGDAFHSSVAMAIMELAPKYGKPIMSVEPVSEEIAKKVASNPKRYWNFWKGDWGSTGYADSVFSTYRFMESKGLFTSKTNKIAFIVEDTDYGRSNAQTTKELFAKIGFQSVAVETVPLGYTDFYPQLGKLKNLGPDVLMSVFTPLSSGVALTKQFRCATPEETALSTRSSPPHWYRIRREVQPGSVNPVSEGLSMASGCARRQEDGQTAYQHYRSFLRAPC